MNLKKTFAGWLAHRYQLVVRNEENFAERATFNFSHAQFISLSVVLLSILVVFSMALTTTILAKWLNPAHAERENREKLVQLALEVDRLEEQTIQQKNFIALLQSIIAGKEPPDNKLVTAEKKQTNKAAMPYSPEELSAADALLRREVEASGSFSPSVHSGPNKDVQEMVVFPPIRGVITAPFKKKRGHYGIDIVAKEREPIKCVADGTVIFASWTLEIGWIVVVQHDKELISIYQHNAAFLKKVGNFVRAGEVMAVVGKSGSHSAKPHLHFELWYGGEALDPEHFVTF
ncbi:MAG: M23 family metallopeptidase [Amoebophilaceae bacterium]|nr:M23 family metallopeptidase [Amoebophilaceae bacterium]